MITAVRAITVRKLIPLASPDKIGAVGLSFEGQMFV